jgi:toxin CcdB
MAQFRVYKNPNKASRKTYPYLLDIQSSLLNELRTTVVIPLCPASLAAEAAIAKLCPTLDIGGEHFIALSQQLAGIDRLALGKEVCDLSHYRADILAAMDFMLSGI